METGRQCIVPFTHRSECGIVTPLYNSGLWNCHIQCISLKPSIIVHKCKAAVKFPVPGESACIADLELPVCRREPARSSVHQLFSWPRKKWPCSLPFLPGLKDTGETAWEGAREEKSGYIILLGCNANMLHKTVNICVTIFMPFFFSPPYYFTFTFSILPFLSGRLVPSITSPWDQVAPTGHRKQQQRW